MLALLMEAAEEVKEEAIATDPEQLLLDGLRRELPLMFITELLSKRTERIVEAISVEASKSEEARPVRFEQGLKSLIKRFNRDVAHLQRQIRLLSSVFSEDTSFEDWRAMCYSLLEGDTVSHLDVNAMRQQLDEAISKLRLIQKGLDCLSQFDRSDMGRKHEDVSTEVSAKNQELMEVRRSMAQLKQRIDDLWMAQTVDHRSISALATERRSLDSQRADLMGDLDKLFDRDSGFVDRHSALKKKLITSSIGGLEKKLEEAEAHSKEFAECGQWSLGQMQDFMSRMDQKHEYANDIEKLSKLATIRGVAAVDCISESTLQMVGISDADCRFFMLQSVRCLKQFVSEMKSQFAEDALTHTLCVVCMTAERAPFVAVPCGHRSFCDRCLAVFKKKGALNCPICRADLDDIIQVFE